MIFVRGRFAASTEIFSTRNFNAPSYTWPVSPSAQDIVTGLPWPRVSVALPLRKLRAGVYEVGLSIPDGQGQLARRVGRFVVTDGAQ